MSASEREEHRRLAESAIRFALDVHGLGGLTVGSMVDSFRERLADRYGLDDDDDAWDLLAVGVLETFGTARLDTHDDGTGTARLDEITLVLGTGGPHYQLRVGEETAYGEAWGWFGADSVTIEATLPMLGLFEMLADQYFGGVESWEVVS